MVTGKILYWLGFLVIVLELVSYIRNMVVIPHTLTNIGISIGSPLFQGGTLIGFGKILQKMHEK